MSGMSAFQRHQQLMQRLQSYQPAASGETASQQQQQRTKTDREALEEAHRFIRNGEDDEGRGWEVTLARKYYARLFKEVSWLVSLSTHVLSKRCVLTCLPACLPILICKYVHPGALPCFILEPEARSICWNICSAPLLPESIFTTTKSRAHHLDYALTLL